MADNDDYMVAKTTGDTITETMWDRLQEGHNANRRFRLKGVAGGDDMEYDATKVVWSSDIFIYFTRESDGAWVYNKINSNPTTGITCNDDDLLYVTLNDTTATVLTVYAADYTAMPTDDTGRILILGAVVSSTWYGNILGGVDVTQVEAIITAELVDGQSIDNAIDSLIATHATDDDAHHVKYTDGEVEAVITAELVDGQSIDNAIDSLINTHQTNSNAHHTESHTMTSHSDDDTYNINTTGTFAMGAAAEDLDMGNFDINNITDGIFKGVIKLYDASGPYTANFIYTFDSDVSGCGVIIQPGGPLVLGGGEGASAYVTGASLTASPESIYLVADTEIQFHTGMQAGYGSHYSPLTLTNTGLANFSGLVTAQQGDVTYGLATQISLAVGVDDTNPGAIRIYGNTAGGGGLIQATTNNLHIDALGGAIYLGHYDPNIIYLNGTTYYISATGVPKLNVAAGADSTYTGIVTSDGGLLEYRTKAQILGDIGAGTMSNLVEDTTPQVYASDVLDLNNTGISLNKTAVTDGKCTGIIVTMYNASGGSRSFGDFVCLTSPWTSGYPAFKLADANSNTTMPIIGMVAESIALSTTGKVLLYGFVYHSTWNWAVSTTAMDNVLYASETAGDLTQTAPTTASVFVQACGIVLGADWILFNPTPTTVQRIA